MQGFATYVSAMSSTHPSAVPKLFTGLSYLDFAGQARIFSRSHMRLPSGAKPLSPEIGSGQSEPIVVFDLACTGQLCELCLSLSTQFGSVHWPVTRIQV